MSLGTLVPFQYSRNFLVVGLGLRWAHLPCIYYCVVTRSNWYCKGCKEDRKDCLSEQS
jgi:hypothetical protein